MNRLRTCIRGPRWGGGVRLPLAAKSRERQNDYFKLKTDFILLNQTEGNFMTFFFNL